MLCGLLAGISSTDALVRATSSCFIAVYVPVLASAVRILERTGRVLASVTLALTIVITVFSAWYLLVPALAGTAALALRKAVGRRRP